MDRKYQKKQYLRSIAIPAWRWHVRIMKNNPMTWKQVCEINARASMVERLDAAQESRLQKLVWALGAHGHDGLVDRYNALQWAAQDPGRSRYVDALQELLGYFPAELKAGILA